MKNLPWIQRSARIAFAGIATPLLGSSFTPTASAADASFEGPLGLQLYSLRARFELKGVERTLDKVKEFGIQYAELVGTYGRESAAFKAELDSCGIKAVSDHFSYKQWRDDPEAIAVEAKALGLQYAGCASAGHAARGPWTPPSGRNPKIDPRLDEVVASAMQAAPENRPVNVSTISEALEEILATVATPTAGGHLIMGADAPSLATHPRFQTRSCCSLSSSRHPPPNRQSQTTQSDPHHRGHDPRLRRPHRGDPRPRILSGPVIRKLPSVQYYRAARIDRP